MFKQAKAKKTTALNKINKESWLKAFENKWSEKLKNIFVKNTLHASLSYRNLSKLIDKDFGKNDSGVSIALSPLSDQHVATNIMLFFGYSLSSELNARVLLVDTNLRQNQESLSSRLNLEHSAGFMQLLNSEIDQFTDLAIKTPVKNVWVLPSGANEQNFSTVFDHNRLQQIVKELINQFDYVVFQQDNLRKDTRYLFTSTSVQLNLLLVEENTSLMSDLEECEKLYLNNEVSNYKIVLAA